MPATRASLLAAALFWRASRRCEHAVEHVVRLRANPAGMGPLALGALPTGASRWLR